MKTNLKDFLWATSFVLIYLSIMIYGLVWLNNGFNVDDRIGQLRQDIRMEMKRDLMPSAYKQEPVWTRKQKKH